MKRYIFVVTLCFSVLSVYADSEELQFYTSQFVNAKTVVDQLTIVKKVAKAYGEDPEAFAFSAPSLKRLIEEYPTIKNINVELDAATDVAWYLTEIIATVGSEDSGQDPEYSYIGQTLWKTFLTFSNPLIKANAVIALGKIKSMTYLPEIVQILLDCNSYLPPDKAAQLGSERIAYAAINALESYADPSGYLPVFFASRTWYTGWVKRYAAETFPKIIEDPTQPLTAVMQIGGYTYAQKYDALQTLEQSTIEDEVKSQVAVAALMEGWRFSAGTVKANHELISLRKLAIDMIARYGAVDDTTPLYESKVVTVLSLLDRSYRYGADDREQRGAIAALGTIASESAVKQLGTYLEDINYKLEQNILTKTDERNARDIILAIGIAANPSVKTTVQASLNLNWTVSVRQLLNQTLEKL
jgi:hypothetical protein